MIGHEYRPGAWIALVTEGAVALVHPGLGDRAARGLWEVARAGSRLGDSLGRAAARDTGEVPAFAVVEPHPQGLRVRVRGDVVVTVGSARVTGAVHAPFREEVLPGEAGFALAAPGTLPDAGPDTSWLPLVGGMVHAAQVRTFDTGHDRHAGLHAVDRDVAPHDGEGSPAAGTLEDTAFELAEDDADLTWAGEPGAPHGCDLTSEDSVSSPVEARAISDGGSEAPSVPAVPEASAASTPPAASRAPAAPVPSASLASEPLLELVFPAGPRVPVTGPVILGRAPEARRVPGDEGSRLLAVPNPERGVSTTHAEIRPAGGYVVVTDLGSTNGTVVHLPGRPPQRLRPGTGVPVPPGAVVELGAEVRVVVERAGTR